MYLQWLVFEEHSKQGTSHCCQLWRQKDFMESDLILRWLEPLGQQKTEIIVMAFMIPCQSFPEYQIQHIPPFWDFGFGTFRFILQAFVPPCGSISYLNMWVHPSEMVIALHSLLGCHRSPDPFKGCTRRFQCHCPERLVPPNCQQQMMDAQGIMHKKWSGWKVKNNKMHMTVLWGSFWPIPSIIFIHSLQLCSTQFPSMNFIVSQSTTTLHSHGCIFPHQPPSRVRGDVDGGLQNHLKLKNAILLRWPSVESFNWTTDVPLEVSN